MPSAVRETGPVQVDGSLGCSLVTVPALIDRWTGGRSDRHLIRAAQAGKRESYDALVHANQNLLRGYLRKRGAGDAVDDILQEVWIAGWRGIDQLKGDYRFRPWIFRIAIRKLVDHGRSATKHVNVPLGAESESIPAPGSDFTTRFVNGDSVRSALTGLPDAQREVIELYYYADLTLAEVADALDRNLNTVKYQFYQANVKLTVALSSQDEAPATSASKATTKS
ncbi:MAG TPA: RNA polymerase sigma factor [Capsulimonadaceae bacterium]